MQATGRLYRRADIDGSLARLDAHFHGRLYEGAMSALVRAAQGTFAP